MSNSDILMHVLAGFNSTYTNMILTITTRVDDFTLKKVHEIPSSRERLLQLKFTETIAITLSSINTGRGRPFASNSNGAVRYVLSPVIMLINVTNALIINLLGVLLL
ncbi:hypothetical protein AXF42_Ash019176 [Apostasia shenzhenica]|uniref:Uncharacterized protein n=1 Tax=Apostasia shenzhenica TaxID=1088818 RepID=A0A2I0B2E6_9ASPA|nr:hypothetical protein AXF42_Ash019176 [Apostasia shenzhenica]